jgi:hypothetical protein
MKCLRILPDMWASTLRWPGRSTRNIVPGNTCVTVPSVTICPSLDIAPKYIRERASLKSSARVSAGSWRSDRVLRDHELCRCILLTRDRRNPILAQLVERHGRQILSEFLTFPPRARLAMFLHSSETVTIKTCPNVARRLIWKRIVRK